jgi:mannan endo-1,4-beta-mannosidase
MGSSGSGIHASMSTTNAPMTIRLAACTLLLALMVSSCGFPGLVQEREGFITIENGRFIHRGAPYAIAGVNMWYGCYIGSPGATGDRPRLIRELDFLKAHSLVNIRALAASEASPILRAVRPAIQRAPGVYDDSLLAGLDFFLAELAKRDMHAVLYLGNFWEWSGGFTQYNTWTGDRCVDPENPDQGWSAFMDSSATFYTKPASIALYRNFVTMLLSRVNTCNGRVYAGDPTIMAWQLANEPRPGRDGESGARNADNFVRWIDETARFIHTLDPHHLVCAGSEGTMGTIRSEDLYLRAYRTPAIDYLNCHLWPLNWSWFDPTHWEETLPSTEENAAAYIRTHIALARTLGKPIVMDEFGLGRDGGAILPEYSTRARDHYFASILRVIEDSVAAGAPFAGSNVWAWGGESRAHHADGMWLPGDPFVGDPPQEPQGRNSIFTSDTSTIRILRDHATRMEKLLLQQK